MKRCISLFLVLVMVFSMVGCDEIAEEAEEIIADAAQGVVEDAKDSVNEAIDNTIDNVKDNVTDAIGNGLTQGENAIKGGLLQGEDDLSGIADEDDNAVLPQDGTNGQKENTDTELSWWNQLLNPEKCTITYNANGGDSAPANQEFRKNTKPTLSNETPKKVGYHFVGWSRLPDNEPRFFSGKRTSAKLCQDTVFYAAWEKHKNPLEDSFYRGEQSHNYHVKCDNKVYSIHCDCGFELTDRNITRSEFLYYKTNTKVEFNSLPKRKQKEYFKEYILYTAQEIGPLAVWLNSSLYTNLDDEAAFDSVIDTVGEIAEFSAKIIGPARLWAEIDLLKRYDSDTDEFIEKFFGGASDAAQVLSLIVSAYQIGDSIHNFFDTDQDIVEGTIGFLDVMTVLTSKLPIGFYYEEMFNILKGGVKLLGECRDTMEIYSRNLYVSINASEYKNVECLFDGDKLDQIFGTTLKNGCICGKGNPKNCFCADGPSVCELLIRMGERLNKSDNFELNDDEQELVMYYLAERSAHELYQQTGITLELYAKLVDDGKLSDEEYEAIFTGKIAELR